MNGEKASQDNSIKRADASLSLSLYLSPLFFCLDFLERLRKGDKILKNGILKNFAWRDVWRLRHAMQCSRGQSVGGLVCIY